jgi:hypothetical protein
VTLACYTVPSCHAGSLGGAGLFFELDTPVVGVALDFEFQIGPGIEDGEDFLGERVRNRPA